MKIRGKLLILLLFIALVPLLISATLHRLSIRRLGNHLAQDAREILTRNAYGTLHRLVDDFGATLERDRTLLKLAVSFQAREVERRLAAPPPATARLFFVKNFEGSTPRPEGLEPSKKHFRADPTGLPLPFAVSYREQVVILPEDVEKSTVAENLARLSTMPEAYRFIHRFSPALINRQYTALESGVHTSFPGHGGYPPGYDPRRQDWYHRAKMEDRLIASVMPEISTQRQMLVGAMPVYEPDGAFAGVTAIDVPIVELFQDLKLPEEVRENAERLVVMAEPLPGETEKRLRIVVRKGDQPSTPERYLMSEDRSELAALVEDLLSGRSGVRKMRFHGEEALWAYGAREEKGPFPVIIVPYAPIVARADGGEEYVLQQMYRGLQRTGGLMAAIVTAVILLAVSRSRIVTSPVRHLAEAAERLSEGDFEARARIDTGDELEELGLIFDKIGPKLGERERMKRSLNMAKEIQQHLLPLEVPKVPGFDIFGGSNYCDETGGDYFDFIPMGGGQLGIAVGDVTGHGAGAALLMASARGVLRSRAGGHDSDLGALFADLNRHLVRDTGDSLFMTLFFGIVQAESTSFRWVSGGHGPVLWLKSAKKEIVELSSSGIPLGIMEEASFEESEPQVLEAGDILLIGTDGIWESRDAGGEMFGIERLRKTLTDCREQSAEEIYAAITVGAAEFRGAGHQEDDVTLVIVKVPGGFQPR